MDLGKKHNFSRQKLFLYTLSSNVNLSLLQILFSLHHRVSNIFSITNIVSSHSHVNQLLQQLSSLLLGAQHFCFEEGAAQ